MGEGPVRPDRCRGGLGLCLAVAEGPGPEPTDPVLRLGGQDRAVGVEGQPFHAGGMFDRRANLAEPAMIRCPDDHRTGAPRTGGAHRRRGDLATLRVNRQVGHRTQPTVRFVQLLDQRLLSRRPRPLRSRVSPLTRSSPAFGVTTNRSSLSKSCGVSRNAEPVQSPTGFQSSPSRRKSRIFHRPRM